MRHFFLYSLLLIICIPALGNDKPTFTFQECLNLALKQNLQLKISTNNGQKASMNRQQSQWELAPSIGGGANSNLNFRRSTNQNNEIESGTTYQIGYGINGSITLFGGLTKVNTIAALKYIEMAYAENTQQERLDLYLQIFNIYTDILYQKQLIDVEQDLVEISKTEVDRISTLIELGRIEQVALHEIKATHSGNLLQLKRMRNHLDLMLLNLAQLIDYSDPQKFEISDDEISKQIPFSEDLSTDQIYKKACANLPALQAKEYELKYSKKTWKISRGNMLPSLHLNGGYRSGFYSSDTLTNGIQTPLTDQFKNYLNPSLGLSLNIPIFNGRSKYLNLKKQQLNIENTMFELENEKKNVRNEMETAVKQFQAYGMEYASALDHLRYVEKSFASNREKFEMGLINTYVFAMAQNQLSEAKANVLQAKFAWLVQQKIIQIYTGEITIRDKTVQ